MYDEITSWDNICQAYLDLYYSFTEESKGFSYNVVDGQTLYEIEVDIEETLKEIQAELIACNPLQPAKYVEIPKKNGEIRGIYMLPVKERIKCQAIYRVLAPYFEKQYSDNLYSFRSSHPSYYASRAVRRLYLRNYGKKNLHVLKMDIHKYSDYHNHDYLINVLRKSGIEQNVMDLIMLFIRQPFIKKEAIMSLCTGTMQGMNLCPVFNNIYIGHIDDYVSERVHFYRRVGDDFIMFDKNKDKLQEINDYISKEAKKAKLILNDDKKIFDTVNEIDFDFLGLKYENGGISLPEKSFDKIITSWKKNFRYNKNIPENIRLKRLKSLLERQEIYIPGNTKETFMNYIRSYNLVTDTNQINKLSKRFFHVISKYITGGTTYRNMAKTKKLLQKANFSSFSKLHYLYTHGKV